MKRLRILLVSVGMAVSIASSASAARPACPQFIVGQANSTAYPNQQLPARGRQVDSSCATLQRMARKIENGTYRIPAWAWVPAPAYGPPFLIRDRGRPWACDVQNNGLSGPSDTFRCDSNNARLWWSTG
jgi:hypothetical protein